ncbi:unnamed protein product [Leptosia nina]|uniref:Uncharacterized protein n=1 Tax=Leptosia nina TaxID=320188 RepID=A0AAV1J4L3_9NEOP
MRLVILVSTFFILLSLTSGAPQSKLQFGNDNKQVLEEVVVESVLHIKSPSGRQARTNTRTNLQDGARVAETKRTNNN